MDISQFIDVMQIPDPEIHRAAARHLQTWYAQHQDLQQQLANGHSQLRASWQGSASDQYHDLHSQMLQLQEEHQQQREQAAGTHLLVAGLLEAAKFAQDMAIAQLVAVGIEVVAGFFTFGITDALAAPEIAAAVETEAGAQASAMGARLALQRGFTALFEMFQAWQKYHVLLQLAGAGTGAMSGVVYSVQHHESVLQILTNTAQDAMAGYAVGGMLGSGNPTTVLKVVVGGGYGAEQVLTGNAKNEDPFAVIAGDGQMIGSTSGSAKLPNFARSQLDDTSDVNKIEHEVFSNTSPEGLTDELAEAERLGVKPLRVGEPGFDDVINEGPIKWAVIESGELRVIPFSIGGIELKHSVLNAGGPVIAAGEAQIAGTEGQYFLLEITNKSGHYLPSDQSLQIGIEAFRNQGIK